VHTGYDVSMKEIPLTQGKVAMVDDDDFEWLNQWKWRVCWMPGSQNFIARSQLPRGTGSRSLIMHRLILNAPPGVEVDHINHDTLDNRRGNIRLCSSSQNKMNRRAHKNSKSGLKGVHFEKERQCWRAEIKAYGKRIYLGRFKDVGSAAVAYDVAALRYHGKFANPNLQGDLCRAEPIPMQA
jgi:hypothetical protein